MHSKIVNLFTSRYEIKGKVVAMTPETRTLEPLFLRNFGELVLGCIDNYDSESRRIFQIFRDLQDVHSFAPIQTIETLKFNEF